MVDRPDDVFQDLVRRGLSVFQNTLQGVTQAITTGDGALRELDQALIGNRVVPGEDTEKAMMEVLTLLQGTLAEARDKGGVEVPSVVQKAREVLARINQAEPAWRPGPVSINNTSDMFRMAMRDLRGTDSLMKLATGRGEQSDVERLTRWADDVNARLSGKETEPAKPVRRPKVSALPENTKQRALPAPKKKSKKTSPAVKFALAVAEEYGDEEVKVWAQEFADGKITEADWLKKLTDHAESQGRNDADEVFERAGRRVNGQK